jgi:hypothetical protein
LSTDLQTAVAHFTNRYVAGELATGVPGGTFTVILKLTAHPTRFMPRAARQTKYGDYYDTVTMAEPEV